MLAKALDVLNYLSQDQAGQTACKMQYSFDTKAYPRPLVMVKDPVTEQRAGPLDVLMWGRGYACVSTGHRLKWVPSQCV